MGTKNVLASRQWESGQRPCQPCEYLLDVSKRCGPDRKAKTGRLNERQYALWTGPAERMAAVVAKTTPPRPRLEPHVVGATRHLLGGG